MVVVDQGPLQETLQGQRPLCPSLASIYSLAEVDKLDTYSPSPVP